MAYHAVDVTDAEAVAAALANAGATGRRTARRRHRGKPDQSPKKPGASFDRVFDTKVFGLRNLLKALEGNPPRYLMTFSSVTARLGNEGQVDYTAANDTIGKMLQHYRAAHPRNDRQDFRLDGLGRRRHGHERNRQQGPEAAGADLPAPGRRHRPFHAGNR